MGKNIKYGVVGVGHLGKFHVQQIQNVKGAVLCGIYDVDFKQIKHEVYYVIYNEETELTRLIHPDYVPDCNFEELNSYLKNQDAQTLFAALCRCQVSIKKEYLKWFEDHQETVFSYHLSTSRALDSAA